MLCTRSDICCAVRIISRDIRFGMLDYSETYTQVLEKNSETYTQILEKNEESYVEVFPREFWNTWLYGFYFQWDIDSSKIVYEDKLAYLLRLLLNMYLRNIKLCRVLWGSQAYFTVSGSSLYLCFRAGLDVIP